MIEFTEDFNNYLRKYENVEIPDLNQFNKELLIWQEKLKEIYPYDKKEKEKFCEYMITHRKNFHEILQISILSILAYLFDGGGYAGEIIDLSRRSPYMMVENKYFIYLQMNSYSFRYNNFLTKDDKWQLRMLYREIYQECKAKLGIEKNIVPIKDRDPKKVVFLIGQFLNENHGPTKTILDRCEIMSEKMNCQSIIINTNELRGINGYIPYCWFFWGNMRSGGANYDAIQYHEKNYPYYECSGTMLNLLEIEAVVNLVRTINPYCIFMVGDASICADLCSNYYPLIDVATVPSGIMTTEGQFLLKGKPITLQDKEYIYQLGKNDDYLQYCLFTSSIMPQKTQKSRQQLNIPEKAFTALVVGARLDYEVNGIFIQEIMLPLIEKGVFFVFMGVFENYVNIVEEYPLLKVNSVFLGFVRDVLAVNELCDVYINPKRNGGGTSVIEAMVKGLPPVALNEGDVSLGAGADFCLDNYQEMVQRTLALKEDAAYYQNMSRKAQERAKVMLDGTTAFWKAFQKIRELPDFQ